MLDQIGDGDHLEAVALAEVDQVGNARHCPVLLHHLADDPGGVEPCQPR
jgi:hypothetical protein